MFEKRVLSINENICQSRTPVILMNSKLKEIVTD